MNALKTNLWAFLKELLTDERYCVGLFSELDNPQPLQGDRGVALSAKDEELLIYKLETGVELIPLLFFFPYFRKRNRYLKVVAVATEKEGYAYISWTDPDFESHLKIMQENKKICFQIERASDGALYYFHYTWNEISNTWRAVEFCTQNISKRKRFPKFWKLWDLIVR